MSPRFLEAAAVGAVLLAAAGGVFLFAATPARAQEAWAPAAGWGQWLGLQPGQTLVYESSDGTRTCSGVGRPIRLAEGLWLPIDRLPWPGFASDSRFLLPLDGPPRLGTIRTPGPRPRLDLYLPASDTLRWGWPPQMEPRTILDAPLPLRGALEDGWYVVGDRADPDLLVYVQCAACMDAGTRLVLERGEGIRSVTTTTIVGTESFHRVEGGCAEMEGGETEFEVYVIPGDEPR